VRPREVDIFETNFKKHSIRHERIATLPNAIICKSGVTLTF
jgi:hypothetical protein